MLFNFYFKG